MQVVIPADAIKILTDQLDKVLSAVESKEGERKYENLPENVVALVDLSKCFAREGKINEAIATLNRAIKDYPQYTRGRLQLVMWHHRQRNSSVALFSAGHAFGTATDTDTKCQLLTLAGDIAMARFRRFDDKDECVQAITFYEQARKEDPHYPHTIWNLIEANKILFGDQSNKMSSLVNELLHAAENSGGQYSEKLKNIVRDWDNVLPRNYSDEKTRLDVISEIIPSKTASEKNETLRLVRRTLVAASVAASLVMVALGIEVSNASTGQISPIVDSLTDVPTEIEPISSSDDADEKVELLNAGVEFDDQELTIIAGVEFDDSELT